MGRRMQVHYIFLEAEADAPADDPTILWSNVGPGASSMFGLFVELGPLLVNENSPKTAAFNATGVHPSLFRNPQAWTRLGSVLLMFDWPPSVVFSYCDDEPAGDGMS